MSTNTTPTTNNPSTVRFNLANDSSDQRKPGKSLNLLDDLRSSWSAEPVCVKYSLKEDRAFVDVDPPTATANGNGASHRADSPNHDGHQEQQLVRRRNLVAKVDDKTTNAKAASKGSTDSRPPANGRSMSFGGAFVPDERWMKKRDQLLGECAEYLEKESLASRYTKDTFKRGFLNKVRIFKSIQCEYERRARKTVEPFFKSISFYI